MKYNILFILLALAFVGCKDCTRYARAYVVDFNNDQGLAGAQVKSYAALNDRSRDERITYTDSAGWFETAFALNDVAKCGNLKLIISHPGYHTAYEVDLRQDDTIYLRKIN